MRKVTFLIVLVVILGMSGVTCAITIDGTFSTSEWAGNFTSEDTNNQNFVGPGFGGQDFDVEYIGAFSDHSTLSIVLQSGFNFADGVVAGGTLYTPGDIFVGIDGVWKYAIDFDAGSDVYNLIEVTSFNDPTIFAASTPFTWDTGTPVTTVGDTFNFIFNDVDGGVDGIVDAQDAFGNASYVLEGEIALNLLGLSGGEEITAHWTMSCGNDVLEHTTTALIPEPATIALLGIGLAGLAGVEVRRRRQKKAVDKD